MSESINPVKIVKVKDGRLEVPEHKEYAVIEGGQMYTYRMYDHTSISGSNVSFSNINPPSDSTLVNKVFLCSLVFEVIINMTLPVGPPAKTVMEYWGSQLSLRCMPVNNSLINLNVTLNSGSFSQDQNDLLPALTRSHFRKLMGKLSTSPNTLDNCQAYQELLGANLNPLGSAQTAEPDSHRARGGFGNIQFISNTNVGGSAQAHFLVTATEPLLLSPLDFDFNNNEPAFVRLTNCSVDGVFDPLINMRVISATDEVASLITSMSVTPKSGRIMFQYITPPVIQKIPKFISYPYYGMTRYVTENPNTLAPLTSTQYTTANLQLNSVPKKVILFVKQTRHTLGVNSPDVFARITGISCNFMNQTILATAQPEQLYAMSKRNGLDMEYSEWFGSVSNTSSVSPSPPPTPPVTLPVPRQVSGVGSIIIMNPVLDWGLPDLLTSGSSSQTMLSIQVNYVNLHPSESKLFSLYLIVVNDGVITLSTGSCLTQDNIVGISDLVKHKATEPAYTNNDTLVQEMQGGNFFSDIKNFFVKNKDRFKTIADLAVKAAPHVLPLLGLGGCFECGGIHEDYNHNCPKCRKYHEYMAQTGLGKVGGKRGRPRGSGLVGGKMLSKKSLYSLMR